jgi:hypothetical protein
MMHLERTFLMLALVLAAPAFADPLHFYKSGAKAGELERTRYACMLSHCTPRERKRTAFYSVHEGARLASDRAAAETIIRSFPGFVGAGGYPILVMKARLVLAVAMLFAGGEWCSGIKDGGVFTSRTHFAPVPSLFMRACARTSA